jgi:lipopolysaccharide biosynthesis glycosyltransferase
MNFTTIVDLTQWSYTFPNILSLETFKRKYTFGIFTACPITYGLLAAKLKQISPSYGDVYVELIPSFFSFFKIGTMIPNHDWISAATMDRFVVPYFCKYEKYLHIDIDTLIVSDKIFDLENSDTSIKGIAATPNTTSLTEHAISFSNAEFLLDLIKDNKYTFNAGIVLFDTAKMKQNNFDKFVRDVYSRGDNVMYINDELILNLYDQQFKILDNKFNIKPYFYEEIKIQPDETVIFHFSGKDYKPWSRTYFSNFSSLRKYYGLWEYYYYSAFN